MISFCNKHQGFFLLEERVFYKRNILLAFENPLSSGNFLQYIWNQTATVTMYNKFITLGAKPDAGAVIVMSFVKKNLFPRSNSIRDIQKIN